MQRGTGSNRTWGRIGKPGLPRAGWALPVLGVLAIGSWVGTAAAEAPIPAPSPGEPPATILALNFEGVDTIAPTVTVPVGTAVTPVASLAGVGASHATGTVTYSVYLDNQCQTAAEAPVVEAIATPGVLPPAPAVVLGAGTYYWTAAYASGGQLQALNQSSSTPCGVSGQPDVTVSSSASPLPRPSPGQPPATVVTVDFTGLDTIATTVAVPVGTPIDATATLAGVNASHASGTVTYGVYTDGQCQNAALAPMVETIVSPGVLPPSPSVVLGVGTYYWKVDFDSGGTLQEVNLSSTTGCGTAGQPNVTVGSPLPVTTTVALTGGGQSGAIITVPVGTTVTAFATLGGPNAALATGWVEYSLYDTNATNCTGSSLSDEIVTAGVLPQSPPVTATSPGTYYWALRYSGDAFNAGSHSGCVAVEQVTAAPAPGTAPTLPPSQPSTSTLHQKRWLASRRVS
jgi:hypothetical protein